jgi:hypothetical protein
MCMYVCECVIKAKGLSKGIVTPLCFIKCAFEILRGLCTILATSEGRTLNAWSAISYTIQDFMS